MALVYIYAKNVLAQVSYHSFIVKYFYKIDSLLY